ncbi:MAG: hypothetical protein K2M08_00805 [Anaeroplasmataceae bacterium]|nr:hypothetical protein [Anaeroplasmataceae bacterium]
MKKIIISSLILSFLCFFTGIGLIIFASNSLNLSIMYAGLSLLCIGILGYTILGFILFFYWYKNKSGVK